MFQQQVDANSQQRPRDPLTNHPKYVKVRTYSMHDRSILIGCRFATSMRAPLAASCLPWKSKHSGRSPLNSSRMLLLSLYCVPAAHRQKLHRRGPTKITKYVEGEVLLLRRFNHPHIVQFIEVFLTEEHLAICMEFLEVREFDGIVLVVVELGATR